MTFDSRNPVSGRESIRNLLQSLVDQLDDSARTSAQPVIAPPIRPSDEKVFMLITGEAQTISQLARSLDISRQAAHASISRLAARNYVRLEHAPQSRRDKIATVTPEGERARLAVGARQAKVEADLEKAVGRDRLDEFQQTLKDLLRHGQKA